MTKRQYRSGNQTGENHRDGLYKFDSKKKEEYIELLRRGGRRYSSARAIKISPATVANHRRDDEAFRSACDLAESEADDEVEDAFRMAAISGNVTAILAWLYSRQSGRWSDTRVMKFDLNKLSNDDIIKLLGIAADAATHSSSTAPIDSSPANSATT